MNITQAYTYLKAFFARLNAQGFVFTWQLGSGTADATTFLRGDSTWAVPPGGSGSADIKQVEVNLGSTLGWRGKFTIVDAAITALTQVSVWQAPGPYTGKGTRADEAEMDPLWCVAEPQAGQATVYWRTMSGFLPTLIPQEGRSSFSQAVVVDNPYPLFLWEMRVRGLVRGNVKFNYLIG